MSRKASPWISVRLLFCMVTACVCPVARADVVVTQIGTPIFIATDFHLFAAPVGTAASGYAEFTQTLQTLLAPPTHESNPVLGIGPGAPHAGPYDQELGQGVAAAGFVESTTFTTAQYSNGSGVFFAAMLVPGPGSATGSSPDFASGPIMPNAIFPLSVTTDTFTDGTLNDAGTPFQVPAIDQVPGFEGLEGHSHIPIFYADNFDFASRPVTGSYEYRISILDATGNGYQIVAPFNVTVVPEAASWMMAGIGSLVVGGLGVRRRRVVGARVGAD